jgi:hypothetical protein
MIIFLLRPQKAMEDFFNFYGRCAGFIIRAKSEAEARKLASLHSHFEGEDVWLDTTMSSCEPLPVNGPEQVIMFDVR